MKPTQRELRTLLAQAGRKSTRTRHHRVSANKLLKIWPALWTFTTLEGVEPTNNAAERALRGPVIHRKLSHRSQSEQGEHFIERALSASLTCRLQGRSLFTYLTELLTAHARGDPLPTLA
jgi:transposase